MSNSRFAAIIQKLKAEGKYDPSKKGTGLASHQTNIASTPNLTPKLTPSSGIKPIDTAMPKMKSLVEPNPLKVKNPYKIKY